MSAKPKPNVVIIGGGYGGLEAAKQLKHTCNVTIIDKKSYFEHVIGVYHCPSAPQNYSKCRIALTTVQPLATIIVGSISSVSESCVVMATGEQIAFDFLIVATGRRYASQEHMKFALSIADGRLLETHQAKIQAADTLCVIGAGPAGVQLAASLAVQYPSKTIHIVSSSDSLLPRTPAVAQQCAADYFAALPNVTVHRNKRVKSTLQDGSVILGDDTIISSKVAFACAGSVPNSEFMQSHLSPHLNTDGSIRVNKHLQVTTNIFAIGDVCDYPEECLSGTARNQARNVAENILNLWHQRPLVEKLPYVGRSVVVMGLTTAVWIDYATNHARTSVLWAILKKTFQMTARPIR